METPSEPQSRVGSPWRGLLITASILSCWIQPMSAQISVVPKPVYGVSVTLYIQGFSGPALSYTWFRKAVTEPNRIACYRVATGVQAPADIREEVLPNGSLLIPDLTLNDTDTYHVTIVNSEGDTIFGQTHLRVYERTTKPHIMPKRTNVIENDTLDFTCGSEQEGVDILWFFDNKPLILKKRMKLSMNNRTLTILSVKREDTGSYECEIRNPIPSSSRSDPIILTVNYGPDYLMFVPNPEKGEIEVKFKGSLTLECRVESYPPAQYIWQLNGTVNSDFSSNTYVIKNATWKDSGKYTCLAKNNVTNLSVSKSITVKVVEQYMGGNDCSSFSGGAITVIVIGVLTGVSLIGILIYMQYFRKTRRASKHQLSEKNHSASKHGEDFQYENIVHFKGSALPAQGLGNSPTFPEDPPESSYQTLDITRVDVYDKIDPWKKPEA